MIDSETVVGTGLRITVTKDELAAKLGIVARGVSTRTTVLVLGGIQLRAEGGQLHLAATDMEVSLRATVEAQVADEGTVVVPGKLLLDIAGTTDEIQLGLQENHVVFGAEGTWLTTRRIDGQFPNYRQLLPEQFEYELALPREELLEVVRRVSLMAQRNSPLRLRFAEGDLTVSAVTQDVGEARESLPAPYTVDAMEIGFNAEFLRDGLDSVDSETLKFKLISPLRPAVLEGEADDYVYLIIPIRLAG